MTLPPPLPTEFDISTESQLSDALSRPYAEDVDAARRLDGDVIVLGAGGKMGPTLVNRIARATKEAGTGRRVYAVSRFSDRPSRAAIDEGAEVIEADLLDDRALSALPGCPYVIYLVGMKFGASGRAPMTWALNAYLPGRIAERFREARIVALSTGNVYPQVEVESGGSTEADDPDPLGEYAQSCLGRERVFQFFSERHGTPVCLLRLNYAVEARYGVLLDIARRVYEEAPVPLETGYVNVIWQGDANSVCFRALDLCESPARILNVTGTEILSVRRLAEAFGERFGKAPVFSGTERPTALLSDAAACHQDLGPPRVTTEQLIGLVARWVEEGRPTHGKPTKFEIRDGRF